MMQKTITSKQTFSKKTLAISSKISFAIATLGQWIFGIYVLMVYHLGAFTNNFAKWNTVLPKGYIPGDWKGNTMVGVHVLLAAIIIIGGPLQIMPFVRNRYKTFHRILGKTYVFTAILVSLAGLLMIWTRGTVGSIDTHIFNSLQAVYIVIFAVLTIRFAQKKQFALHDKWALRLYVVSNGVWFFRVGLMAWLMINQAPVGFDPDTFTGPFLSLLAFFTYACPLALVLLEMYFWANRKQNKYLDYITSTLITLFSIIMAIGIAGATMGMWLPRI